MYVQATWFMCLIFINFVYYHERSSSFYVSIGCVIIENSFAKCLYFCEMKDSKKSWNIISPQTKNFVASVVTLQKKWGYRSNSLGNFEGGELVSDGVMTLLGGDFVMGDFEVGAFARGGGVDWHPINPFYTLWGRLWEGGTL